MAFKSPLIVAKNARPTWYPQTSPYGRSRHVRSCWQLASTLIPYLLLLVLMICTVRNDFPYLITLALAVVAAAFFVRLFIIFHDCVNGVFVISPRWNRYIGYLCGILTFSAFGGWRR